MKNILIVIFCSIISLNSFSQNSKDRVPAEEKKALRLIESKAFTALNLSTDQKTQILPILIAQTKSIDSLDYTERLKSMDIQKLNDVRILGLLDEKQKIAYFKYVEQRNAAALAANNPPATAQPRVIRSTGVLIAVPAGQGPPR